jgi:tRNA 2-selenouridine synthase
MSIEKISVAQLLELARQYPILDVRSPGEYAGGHIPGAYSLPLFSDEERKVVGTAYKKEGKEQAIKAGLEYFGKKMVPMIGEAETRAKDRTVILHCWRGGMRSGGVAWLLDLYGFTVYTLTGGYKSFRRWCTTQFTKDYPFTIIGGYTGSGKTQILNLLRKKGHRVIDLEELACHKGSVFGNLGGHQQPTQEMFENRLAMALAGVATTDRIWIEDESRRIGNVNIPPPLYITMQKKPVCFLEIPFEERLKNILDGYGKFEKEKLADAITLLRKRLGGTDTKSALLYLENDDLAACFGILLKYYDKHYLKGLLQKDPSQPGTRKIGCDSTDAAANSKALLNTKTIV